MQMNGKAYNVLGFKESILLKWPYTQGNLQTQCNPNQNVNGVSQRNRTN